MRRILPIISMLITLCSPAQKLAEAVEHLGQFSVGRTAFTGSVFGQRQHSTDLRHKGTDWTAGRSFLRMDSITLLSATLAESLLWRSIGGNGASSSFRFA